MYNNVRRIDQNCSYILECSYDFSNLQLLENGVAILVNGVFHLMNDFYLSHFWTEIWSSYIELLFLVVFVQVLITSPWKTKATASGWCETLGREHFIQTFNLCLKTSRSKSRLCGFWHLQTHQFWFKKYSLVLDNSKTSKNWQFSWRTCWRTKHNVYKKLSNKWKMSYNNQHLNIKQSKQPSSRWDISRCVISW